MGKNLVLNLADHGYRVAVYNRTTAVTNGFIEQYSTQYQSLAASAQGILPPSPPGRGVGGEGSLKRLKLHRHKKARGKPRG